METPDILDFQGYPEFLESADILRRYISALSYEEAKALWKCNDKIAEQNFERFRYMDLRKNLTPALIAYEGIQYQYMAAAVLEAEAVAYLQAHLRILSWILRDAEASGRRCALSPGDAGKGFGEGP